MSEMMSWQVVVGSAILIPLGGFVSIVVVVVVVVVINVVHC